MLPAPAKDPNGVVIALPPVISPPDVYVSGIALTPAGAMSVERIV